MKTNVNLKLVASQSSKKPTFFKNFIGRLCPCIFGKSQSSYVYQNTNEQQTKSNINKRNGSREVISNDKKESIQTFQTVIGEGDREKNSRSSLSINIPHQVGKTLTEKKKQINQPNNNESINYISSYKQEQLLILGKNNLKMLSKISSVKLIPSMETRRLVERTKKQDTRNTNNLSNIDKYWNERYYLFQKFDQGISINQNSWPIIIPQVVSEHVSSKIKCQNVINIQCGIGSQAIKLSNSCKKVYAYDQSQQNIKCLRINSKIYGVDNITILAQILNRSEQIQAQVALISHYQQSNEAKLSSSVSQCKSNLSKFIQKAFTISKNLVIILPINANIEQIVSIVAEQLSVQNIITESCFLKIEKIYFMDNLKYIVLYYGNFQQQNFKINDELNWIYNHLRIDKKNLNIQKKILKKVRQACGMVKLLNIVLQISKNKQDNLLQNLINYLKQKKIISKQKLTKLEKQLQNQQNNNEQQNTNQVQNQRTVSIVSSISYPNRQSLQNRMLDSCSQVKRQGHAYRLTHKSNSDFKGIIKRTKSIEQDRRDSQNSNNSNVVEYHA